MIFEAYCAYGSGREIKNLLPQLNRYRMQLYKTKEISLSRKVYYIGCGVIVEYNLGQMVAVLWKRVKEAFKK